MTTRLLFDELDGVISRLKYVTSDKCFTYQAEVKIGNHGTYFYDILSRDVMELLTKRRDDLVQKLKHMGVTVDLTNYRSS